MYANRAFKQRSICSALVSTRRLARTCKIGYLAAQRESGFTSVCYQNRILFKLEINEEKPLISTLWTFTFWTYRLVFRYYTTVLEEDSGIHNSISETVAFIALCY